MIGNKEQRVQRHTNIPHLSPITRRLNMRHLKKGRKFGRTINKRRSLLRNLMFQLITRERITTTEAKAKELRPILEKLVTIAKAKTLASKRALLSRLSEHAVKKLEDLAASRYADRRGGYVRIIRMGARPSDASREAIIEFVQ